MFLHMLKHGKLALALNFPEGSPFRPLLAAKVQAVDKGVRGIEAMIRGSTSEILQEALREMISALDDIAVAVPDHLKALIYQERTGILSLSERLKGIDEILAMPDGVDSPKDFVN